MSGGSELTRRVACFGTEVALYLGAPPHPGLRPEWALEAAVRRLQALDATLSRFRPDSELSRLNADPRARVPASSVMCRLVAAGIAAAARTGGLVDFALLDAIERAGYRHSRAGQPPLEAHEAVASAIGPRPARPRRDAAWRAIQVDPAAQTVTRPPGLRIDPGGIGKGLAADLVGETLARWSSYAMDCGGDVRLGGSSRLIRHIDVQHPFGRGVVQRLSLRAGGVATSGVTARSWRAQDGRGAHHLLDPATGRPARTGVIQTTAIAPSATEAETLAKAALLAGPDAAPAWLPHGGVLVLESGEARIVAPVHELRDDASEWA